MIEMIKGIIFDMDGVISDTQKLHAKVESELLSRHGVNLTPEEITKKYAGVRTKDFFKDLLDKTNKKYDLDEVMKENWDRMAELAKISVDEVDGAKDLIKKFYAFGFPMAVGSASNYSYVVAVLEKLNVKQYFKAIVAGDLVKKGKPNPEIFLTAAKKIGISPEECLVIEDGAHGMTAAKKAKMKCIGLVKNKDEEYPTKNLVTSLRQISLEYLREIS